MLSALPSHPQRCVSSSRTPAVNTLQPVGTEDTSPVQTPATRVSARCGAFREAAAPVLWETGVLCCGCCAARDALGVPAGVACGMLMQVTVVAQAGALPVCSSAER